MRGQMEYKALDSKVLVVAIEGNVGDWSAYIGAVNGNNFDKEYFDVADSGSKLPQKVAEVLFPDWAKKLRWRL